MDPEYAPEYVQRILGASSESRRREVASLSLLLREIWDARQAGKHIHPRDEGRNWGSKDKYLGFIIDAEWVLCLVTGARGQDKIDPEVAALFGLTPEEAKEFLFDYKLRQWLAGWFPELKISEITGKENQVVL